jgi:arylformamidase
MPQANVSLSRREAIGGLAAITSVLGTAGVGSLALAQDSGASGPLVWRDMDQAALDAAYDQSAYAPAMADHIARRGVWNRATLQRLAEPQVFSYGTRPVENVEVHRALASADSLAPVQIFFHGGAWRAGMARDYTYNAESFVNAGAHCVIPDYSWVQDVGGDLAVLGDQARRAVAWVYQNAERFGGDPNRIYISGHSAGGHLAGVVLTTDWRGQFGLPADFIKGGFVVSGMFDLEPVRLSSRSEYVNINDNSEDDLSPQRHLDQLHAPLVLAYGTRETPEFQRQSRDFAAAIRESSKPVELIVAEGYYHLEMAESLANPFGIVGNAALAQMGLV